MTGAGSSRRPIRGRFGAALLGVGVVAFAAAAVADQVTSKGTVLSGKVTALSSDGLTFESAYGTGALAIAWKDVEDVKTDGSLQVLYGDGLEADAPLQGFSDGKVLVGGDPTTATAIPTAELHSAVPIGPDGLSWQDKLRSYFRYWDGSADLGLSLQQATTDTFGFLIGMSAKRTNAPTRLLLGADYRYSTQKQKGKSEETIEDRAFGTMRGEYDLSHNFYLFGSGDATYDAIQRLSIRGVPKAGAGYLIWEEKLDAAKRNFLSVEAGGAWVYEGYFGGTNNDYFAVAFGAGAAYYLPYDAYIGWRLDYLPAVDDFTNDYLLRNALELTAPLIDPISAKLSLIDEYDNTPAPGSDRNSLYLALGISVGW